MCAFGLVRRQIESAHSSVMKETCFAGTVARNHHDVIDMLWIDETFDVLLLLFSLNVDYVYASRTGPERKATRTG